MATDNITPESAPAVADILVAGRARRPAVHPVTAVTALLAAVAALVIVVAPSAPPASTRTPDPPASAARDVTDGRQRTVLALARRCVDARHVSLVAHALEHGRPLTLAQARGWCDGGEAMPGH